VYTILDLPLDCLGEEITLGEMMAQVAEVGIPQLTEKVSDDLAKLEAMLQPGDKVRRINRREGGLAIVRDGQIVIAVGFIMI
jgi:hypothetical protein